MKINWIWQILFNCHFPEAPKGSQWEDAFGMNPENSGREISRVTNSLTFGLSLVFKIVVAIRVIHLAIYVF